MALRKPLFLNVDGGDVFHDQVPLTDTLEIGGATVHGPIAMNGGGSPHQITGLADGTAATDAVTKGQLDSAVSGLHWKDPVQVLKMVDDSLVTSPTLTAGDAGNAYVVAGTGGAWSGFAIGDIVEWDGSTWNLVLAGSGGEPPDGTRVVVTDGTPAGSFAGQTNDIATYDATGNSWSFYDALEGDAFLVVGENSVYENIAYTWDATAWVQFTGAGQIVAGDGLGKTGNTLFVNAGDGISIVTDRVTVDLATNSGLQLTGTTPDAQLEWDPDNNRGLAKDATGAYIRIPTTNEGLTFVSGELDVLLRSGFGIAKDTDEGLYIKIDDTPDTLDVDGDGLKVVGLPSLFKINDVAVGASVTAANLTTLTNGSNADALHTHDIATLARRVENEPDAGEAIAIGDPLYISAADTVSKADAARATLAKNRVVGVAGTAQGTVGQPVELVSDGVAPGVLSGATGGTPYYVNAGGGLTTTPPAGPNRLIKVGYALNANDLFVQVTDLGARAA